MGHFLGRFTVLCKEKDLKGFYVVCIKLIDYAHFKDIFSHALTIIVCNVDIFEFFIYLFHFISCIESTHVIIIHCAYLHFYLMPQSKYFVY